MAIFFMGGEDIDFAPLGTVSVNTVAGETYRADYARCSLGVAGSGVGGNGWRGAFSAPASDFWMGVRVACDAPSNVDPGLPLVTFADAGSRRLGLLVTSARTLVLGAWDAAGAFTKLAESAPGAQPAALHKLDLHLTYGAAGSVRVFVNQTEVITYNGDVTRSSSSTLNGFTLAHPATTGNAFFSEVFVTDRDSRTLMLKTHIPVGNEAGNQWQGGFSDIDEAAVNESDTISTNATDQVATFNVNQLPAGTNLAIRGFKVSGYAARGETGPQKLELGVTTNSQTVYSADLAVDTGWTRLNNVWEQNPVTNSQWLADDINAIKIGVKSKS